LGLKGQADLGVGQRPERTVPDLFGHLAASLVRQRLDLEASHARDIQVKGGELDSSGLRLIDTA
jgi:hypothetical protein